MKNYRDIVRRMLWAIVIVGIVRGYVHGAPTPESLNSTPQNANTDALESTAPQDMEATDSNTTHTPLPGNQPGNQIDESAQTNASLIDREPSIETYPPIAKSTKESSNTRNEPNEISNCEFKMDGEKSRIVISSNKSLKFQEVRNATVKQVVYIFQNTIVSQKLQRAYDTSEFPSPVALFTVLQAPELDPPITKLIVQMHETRFPDIMPHEKGVIFEFPAPSNKDTRKLVFGEEESSKATEENIYSGAQVFKGKKLERLEIKNSDVQDVLRLIAKSSEYNIVIGDDVTGKVGTLSLENIPWDQAFALVLQSKKLGFVRQGNVIRVGTLASLTREKEEALANEASKIKVEPLRTVLIPISYAKADELTNQVKNFLSERGSTDVDARTNTLIIKDIDRAVTRIQKLISVLDTQPAQVSITARFVEVGNQFQKTIGFAQTNLSSNLGGVNLDYSAAYSNAKGWASARLNAPSFAKLLMDFKLGESEKKIRELASPTISIVANQQGTINQSMSVFVKMVEYTAGGNPVATLKQVTGNLTLNVLPIVAGDGAIFLTVNIRNEVISDPVDPKIDGRNIQTQVLIDNGDTAVIGGVFKNSFTQGRDGTPFLMNIPIIGFFFSAQNTLEAKSEIFIFLTAKILNLDESFKRSF